MGEEVTLGIEEVRDGVRVVPRPESTDVQLEVLADVLQELRRVRPDPRVVHGGAGPVELEVVDVLDVLRDVVVGGVDDGLVEVDQEDQLAVLAETLLVLLAED